MDGPLVSIVIATYNMARYLPLAVRTALEQSYRNVEVLIVDDGSNDETAKSIESFLQDRRIRYIFQENRGQAAAKNRGVLESSGKYVAFLDADDLWALDKLARQIPLFSRSPTIGVVYSRLIYIDESGQEHGVSDNELFRGNVSGPLFIRNFIGFGTSIVKKECFERLGGFNEDLRMGIDYDLWLRFSTKYEFDYIDHPLLYYRVWPGQMSNNCKSRYLNGIAIMKGFIEQFPDVVDKKTQKEAWAHTYVGYGWCLHKVDKKVGSALKLYARALRIRPSYFPAWRAIATTLLPLQ